MLPPPRRNSATMNSLDKTVWRSYRVARKIVESSVITSFELVPADGSIVLPYEPGQFLTFRITPEDERSETRHYSLSGDPADSTHYRVSVKREPAPANRPDLAPGRMSRLLHDQIRVGDELIARGPEGKFVLDRPSSRPVVLLAGGIGATPLLAMAHSLCAEGIRKTWFIHGCDNREVQAFGSELRALAARHDNLNVHVLYRVAGVNDVPGVHHDSEGLVTRALLQRLLPLDDYDFYLCGPTPFIQNVYDILGSLGVQDNRIAYEFFGPATLVKQTRTPVPEQAIVRPQYPQSVDTTGADNLVVFAKSGFSAPWTADCDSMLEFAEGQGLEPSFSCRVGICNTCSCEILEGEVEYHMEPLNPPAENMALLCCCRPRGRVSVAL